MDKTHHLSSPMVVCSLDLKNDSFHPYEKGEELFDLEVPHLSVIDAIMYHANCTLLDIAFFCKYICQVQFRSNLKTLE